MNYINNDNILAFFVIYKWLTKFLVPLLSYHVTTFEPGEYKNFDKN